MDIDFESLPEVDMQWITSICGHNTIKNENELKVNMSLLSAEEIQELLDESDEPLPVSEPPVIDLSTNVQDNTASSNLSMLVEPVALVDIKDTTAVLPLGHLHQDNHENGSIQSLTRETSESINDQVKSHKNEALVNLDESVKDVADSLNQEESNKNDHDQLNGLDKESYKQCLGKEPANAEQKDNVNSRPKLIDLAESIVDQVIPPRKTTSTKCTIVYLKDWFLIKKCLTPDDQDILQLSEWIILAGTKFDDGLTGNLKWSSSLITGRVGARALKTSSGKVYMLVGDMSVSDMLKNGMSEEMCEHFKLGFPLEWKALIKSEMKPLYQGPSLTRNKSAQAPSRTSSGKSHDSVILKSCSPSMISTGSSDCVSIESNIPSIESNGSGCVSLSSKSNSHSTEFYSIDMSVTNPNMVKKQSENLPTSHEPIIKSKYFKDKPQTLPLRNVALVDIINKAVDVITDLPVQNTEEDDIQVVKMVDYIPDPQSEAEKRRKDRELTRLLQSMDRQMSDPLQDDIENTPRKRRTVEIETPSRLRNCIKSSDSDNETLGNSRTQSYRKTLQKSRYLFESETPGQKIPDVDEGSDQETASKRICLDSPKITRSGRKVSKPTEYWIVK